MSRVVLILITTAILAWVGVTWPGLVRPGLAWPGPAWLGLAWLGLAWPADTSLVLAEQSPIIDVATGPHSPVAGASAPGSVPGSASAPRPLDGTPITEPEPELHPIYLPFASVEFDALLPPPLETRTVGWVGSLTPSGREACYPATHVLLQLPEGTGGNRAIAVLRPMRPEDPALNFDLFAGEYVEVVGASEPVPAACIITWQQLAVGIITAIDPPPP